jgi:hypothetical protein
MRNSLMICICITYTHSHVSVTVIKQIPGRTHNEVNFLDSSVGIATGYGLGDQGGGSSSPGRVKNFHFSISSTQPLIKWVPGALPRYTNNISLYCGVFTPCKNCNIETRSRDYATVDEAVFSPCRAEPKRAEESRTDPSRERVAIRIASPL